MLVLAAHHISIRIAWVFKTESVIMPAFMDHIAGAGWLRGFLPVLNRVGQSLPPLLLAERLKNTRRKKWTLFFAPLMMSIPFLALSAIWLSLDEKGQWWLPIVFLVLYFFFFCMSGIHQLAFGTLQGKLIRADRRGQLLSICGVVGSILSVTCLWLLLQGWLEQDDGGFGLIFGFAGVGFFVSGLFVLFLVEPQDDSSPTRWTVFEHFQDAWRIFRHDSRFRRVAVVAMCFSPVILLFPHYQALGRRGASIQTTAFDIMLWVIAQNIAVGVYSFIAGFLADRFGNRLVLRGQLVVCALAPLLAITLMSGAINEGQRWYWLTFCLIGIAPVTMRTLVNFTLELTARTNHPRYVSTLSVCLALPFCTSPLVGYCVDLFGFAPVFIGASLVISTGFLLSFRLPEPRFD
jgi:MFS-type transporter involved in bile tolerance (Atg22 family)